MAPLLSQEVGQGRSTALASTGVCKWDGAGVLLGTGSSGLLEYKVGVGGLEMRAVCVVNGTFHAFVDMIAGSTAGRPR